MSGYELDTSIYDDESLLKGFTTLLSWDYPDDWCLKDVQDAVFHVLDNNNTQRSESEFICSCVQSSGTGVILSQPNPETDAVPCELHFTTHPFSSGVCITKVVVVSEAKHLELYLDDIYEKTSKGCMLTMKKGRKAALYENEFDLSSHVQGTHKLSIKFKSLPSKHSMHLQTVVVKVVKCSDTTSMPQTAMKGFNPSSIDVNGVRNMLDAMGLSIPNKANKLLTEIEQQQKQLQGQATQMQNMLQFRTMAQAQLNQSHLNGHHAQQQTFTQPKSQMQQSSSISTQQQQPFMSALAQQPQVPILTAEQQLQVLNLVNNNQSTPLYPSRSGNHYSPRGINQQTPRGHNQLQRRDINQQSLRDNHFGSEQSTPGHSRQSSSSTLRNEHFGSVDHLVGLGRKNPAHESILSNAILNTDHAREVAKSRSSVIEDENFQQAQIELVKNFLKSQDSTKKISITKVGSPEKPPRRLRPPEKRRPLSLPSSSEADFTRLLVSLMEQENLKYESNERSDDEASTASTNSGRWEAYLRSRIRASQRMSSSESSRPSSTCTSETTEKDYQRSLGESNRKHPILRSDLSMPLPEPKPNNSGTERCKKCGCPGCNSTFNSLTTSMLTMEQRVTDRMEFKFQELRHHIDMRLDSIYDVVMTRQPRTFKQPDYTSEHDTAV